MTKSEFLQWALVFGVEAETVELLSAIVPADDDSVDMIYSYAGIRQMNEDEDYPIEAAAVAAGMLIIGSGLNGDPIAMDLKKEPNTIHFVFYEELEEITVLTRKIANNPDEYSKFKKEDRLPYDYFEALDWEC